LIGHSHFVTKGKIWLVRNWFKRMLEKLSVCNLAVIERAEAQFSKGLNVLTGETGSGKSVLMRALELVLGARADSAAVREGASEARIEAVFSSLGEDVDLLLETLGLSPCEEGCLIVRRAIAVTGTSRAWVNDCPATLSTLKKLGSLLADMHGPRANYDLLDEKFQRDAVDAGGVEMSQYSAAWADYASLKKKLDDLDSAVLSDDELDVLRYQISEFTEADLSSDDEDIAERHSAAAHAEETVSLANEATDALGGEFGVSEGVAKAVRAFSSMSKYFSEANAWVAEAEEISARADSLSRSVAEAITRLDIDPEEFEALDARLGVVNRLKRKYLKNGESTVAALIKIFEEKKDKLSTCENLEENKATLSADVEKAFAKVVSEGKKLTAKRRKVAEKMGDDVSEALKELGFPKARFFIELHPAEPTQFGADKVVCMFEPNPGQSARPLRDIASSGEIARVMLALKGVLARRDVAGTLVFDEIDSNIGGEAGSAVGRRMRLLATSRQVIAISHLPQSSVYAERHIAVSKKIVAGKTKTEIKEITGKERIDEIVRMMGGGQSQSARAHAEELLESALGRK
jgi:DNA repair protein RecN (Recombination protein N)